MAEKPATESAKSEDEADKEILRVARERFHLAAEAENENRLHSLDDLRFSSGQQWDARIKSERDQEGRPSLVINRLPQFIRQITNDQKQNKPSIKVNPIDDKGDPEVAKILQGMVRHIEYNSNAEVAYDTAFDGAVRGGIGWFRILTEYCDPASFDQELIIKRIRNPFSVYKDPHSKEPDGSDMEYLFFSENISKTDFKSQFPKAKEASADEFSSIGDQQSQWLGTDSVRVAEYFYKEYRDAVLVLLSDDQVFEKSELGKSEDGQLFILEGMQPLDPAAQIVKERPAKIPLVKWVKMSGLEILDRGEWMGCYIPFVQVIGEELDIDGKVILQGVVRNAKDSQRMYNYWASAETEAIALAPRAPFIGAEGQFEGHEGMWAQANRKNFAFLEYKPTSIGGVPNPPPQRQVYEPAVQAITQARGQAGEDLKATTGIYDAALGNRSNETSGKAILARSNQAQTSNLHFVENLKISLRHAGRILIELIPKVYDAPRAARIIGEDGEQEIVLINQFFEENGAKKIYNLGAGKYDVVVETGPSYATKRQEAAAAMMEFVRVYPPAAQVAGDIIVKNMDWPGSSELSERIKKTLPPGVADDPKDKGPLPPEVQAKMEQMGQMVQQLTEELNVAKSPLELKRMELESRERIEFKKLEVEVELKRAELDQEHSTELLNAEIAQINQRLELMHIDQPIDDEQQELGAGPQGQMPEMPTGGPTPGLPME